MFNISRYLKKIPPKKTLDLHITTELEKDEVLDECSNMLNSSLLFAKAHNIPLPMVFNIAKKKMDSNQFDYNRLKKDFQYLPHISDVTIR